MSAEVNGVHRYIRKQVFHLDSKQAIHFTPEPLADASYEPGMPLLSTRNIPETILLPLCPLWLFPSIISPEETHTVIAADTVNGTQITDS